MELMNQPHNKTDTLAYCKGDVLKELHEEQKSGRVSKALKYYKMVSSGRKNAMNDVIEEDKKKAKEAKEQEQKEFDERRRKRIAQTKLENLSKGLGGKGNTRNRMMARTTFGEKSLHSDKFVKRKKQLESKFLDPDALEEDKKREKKRRKKEKKRKRLEAEAKAAQEVSCNVEMFGEFDSF